MAKKFLTDEEMSAMESQAQKKFISDEEMAQIETEELEQIQEEPSFGKRLLKSTAEALPTAGGLIGGGLGLAGGPLAAMGLAAGGAALGKATENVIEKYLLDEEKTRPDIYGEPALEAVKAAAGEGVGQIISKPLAKGAEVIGKTIEKTIPKLKETAPQIMQAAEEIGIKPTKGMLYDDPMVGALESSIEQSPTVVGILQRKEIEPIRKQTQKVAEDVFQNVSYAQPSDVGDSVKKGIRAAVEKRLEPLSETYDAIRESTQYIDLNNSSLKRVGENIRKLVPYKIGDDYAFVNSVADQLQSGAVKTADNLKEMRSIIGNEIKKDPTNSIYKKVYGKLADLEQNTMMREAIRQARTEKEGKTLGKKLVQDLKEANKGYKGLIEDLTKVGKGSGTQSKVDSIEGFLLKLESLPDEAIPDKMFKVGNRKYLEDLKKSFPEQFDSLKNAKIRQMYEGSLYKNEINLGKFIKQLKEIEPDTRTMMFGKDANKKLSALETLYNNFPEKVGKSGTPQGIELANYFGIGQYIDEVGRAGQYAKLKGLEGISSAKSMAADILQSTPIMQNLSRISGRILGPQQEQMIEGYPESQTSVVYDPINVQMYEADIQKIQSPMERAKKLNLLRKHGRIVLDQ